MPNIHQLIKRRQVKVIADHTYNGMHVTVVSRKQEKGRYFVYISSLISTGPIAMFAHEFKDTDIFFDTMQEIAERINKNILFITQAELEIHRGENRYVH